MHLKDFFSKQCVLGTIGLCLAGFGAMFSVFWIDFFESMLAKVSFQGGDQGAVNRKTTHKTCIYLYDTLYTADKSLIISQPQTSRIRTNGAHLCIVRYVRGMT